MIRDGLGVLERTAIKQICRDTSGSECVAAGGVGQSSLLRPPLDHLEDVEPAHCVASELVAL